MWHLFDYKDKDSWPEKEGKYNVYLTGIDEYGLIQIGYAIRDYKIEHYTPLWMTLDNIYAWYEVTPEQEALSTDKEKYDLIEPLPEDIDRQINMFRNKDVISLISNYLIVEKNKELDTKFKSILSKYITKDYDFDSATLGKILQEWEGIYLQYIKEKGSKKNDSEQS